LSAISASTAKRWHADRVEATTFFGFDVRNARASIDREMDELRKVIAEAKTLKEELEKTGRLIPTDCRNFFRNAGYAQT